MADTPGRPTPPTGSSEPNGAPRPPLRDVAALAGVSEPTVSRVLNGREGVAARTRERVIAALETLGYHDVPEPKPVRRGVVGIVGGEFLNPVFPVLTHHVATKLARMGFLSSLAVSDRELAPEERCIDELVAACVDAVVLIAGRHAEVGGELTHYHRLATLGMPMVFLNGAPTGIDAPHVRCDEEAGARKAVSHLISLGHTRIGCLLGDSRYVPTERFIAGYRATLAASGLPEPPGAIVETAFTIEGGRAGARRLLDTGVTAIIAGNDLMALGALQASGDESRDPVSVVGYDGTELTAYTDPPLTTLRQPFEDMAQLVADAVTSEIDGSSRYRDHYVFEPQLVTRDSTRSLRATAPLG